MPPLPLIKGRVGVRNQQEGNMKYPRFGFKHGFWFDYWPTAHLGVSFIYNRHVKGRTWTTGDGKVLRFYSGFYGEKVRKIAERGAWHD